MPPLQPIGSRALQLLYREHSPKEGDTVQSILKLIGIEVGCQSTGSSRLEGGVVDTRSLALGRSTGARVTAGSSGGWGVHSTRPRAADHVPPATAGNRSPTISPSLPSSLSLDQGLYVGHLLALKKGRLAAELPQLAAAAGAAPEPSRRWMDNPVFAGKLRLFRPKRNKREMLYEVESRRRHELVDPEAVESGGPSSLGTEESSFADLGSRAISGQPLLGSDIYVEPVQGGVCRAGCCCFRLLT